MSIQRENVCLVYAKTYNMRMSIAMPNFLRIQLWWNHIVPTILTVVYFLLIKSESFDPQVLFPLVYFLFSIIGIAAFGYFLNDWTDIESDRIAGKSNSAIKLKPFQRLLLIFSFLTLGLLPWLILPISLATFGLLWVLIACLVVYSLPPFRFKERSLLGNICDIHYGHVLPAFIAYHTFSIILAPALEIQGLGILFYILLFAKGFRNIITHQIEDRKNDGQSNTETSVLKFGLRRSVLLVNFFWILEIVLTFILLSRLGSSFIFIWYLFIGYMIFLILWKTDTKSTIRYWYLNFWYSVNDFCEIWLPIYFLFLFVKTQPQYWWLLAIHLILFPNFIRYFRKGLKSIMTSSRSYQILKSLNLTQ